MGEQIPEFTVVEFVLDIEVNGHHHPFQGSVVLFNRLSRLVEFCTNVMFEVLEVLLPRLRGHIEGLVVLILVICKVFCL
ncbi:hypothetical protein [Synechococcus sp. M16CYN]|uniref:hypothetical protein n=1 Tax=Synechococcus sp. M16CYN TaxID=3103139 RepID=UPI0033419248